MKRCEACGGELELPKGTIVEVNTPWSDWAGLATILDEPILPNSTCRGVVMITGRSRGQMMQFDTKYLRVVHGYIHLHRHSAIGTWIGPNDPNNYYI